MKKKRVEKSRLPLDGLLAKRKKLRAIPEQIVSQSLQLEHDKKVLDVSEKWFEEREVEIGDERRLMGVHHVKKIQNSALIRFRSCRDQIDLLLQKNTSLQGMLTSQYWIYQLFSEFGNEPHQLLSRSHSLQTEAQGRHTAMLPHRQNGESKYLRKDQKNNKPERPKHDLFQQEHGLSLEQVVLIKKCIAYLILYWKYTLKEREVEVYTELGYLQRLIDEKCRRSLLVRWLDRHLIENISANQKLGWLSSWYSRLRGFEPIELPLDDERTDLPLGLSFS